LADFQNPQNEPGTEKRLLLVFALTFLVILVFQPLLKKYLPQPPAPATQNPPTAQLPAAPANAAASPPRGSAPPTLTQQAPTETETVVDSDLYRVTFTNRGGQVKSWILKQYDDDHGKPLDLVNNAAAAKYGYPLSLWTYDETLRNKLNSALYVPSASGALAAPATLIFEYSDQGLTVRKTFRFDRTYVVRLETSVLSNGSPFLALPTWPAGFGDENARTAYASSRIEYHNDESAERTWGVFPKSTERLAVKSVSGGKTVPGPLNWAGAVDQYFGAVFIPDDPRNAALVTLRNALDIPKDERNPNPRETVPVDVLGAAVGDPRCPTSERIFVGPKTLQVLEAIPVASTNGPNDLRDLVNFGFFGIIARPLFLWLRWTYAHIVPNWGWAIVLQTFIITLALLPLRIYQMKSALKMQKVAPQAKAIQEKYKKYSMRDPRKQDMQKEIAELYKAEGVNPVGGCLPLIIQMPFLFAYYSMLNAALDLRHAHWLWIHDLSSRDPYFLLPLAMIVSMLVSQRMTPQVGMDPAQQKMMTITMPLMMGFIFFNLAAGLNLYYAESNLIMIVQQAVMNRTSLGREMREMALKRARKKGK
jgi:YidC/Oxa1 family membrane protein insertase